MSFDVKTYVQRNLKASRGGKLLPSIVGHVSQLQGEGVFEPSRTGKAAAKKVALLLALLSRSSGLSAAARKSLRVSAKSALKTYEDMGGLFGAFSSLEPSQAIDRGLTALSSAGADDGSAKYVRKLFVSDVAGLATKTARDTATRAAADAATAGARQAAIEAQVREATKGAREVAEKARAAQTIPQRIAEATGIAPIVEKAGQASNWLETLAKWAPVIGVVGVGTLILGVVALRRK